MLGAFMSVADDQPRVVPSVWRIHKNSCKHKIGKELRQHIWPSEAHRGPWGAVHPTNTEVLAQVVSVCFWTQLLPASGGGHASVCRLLGAQRADLQAAKAQHGTV